MGGAAVGNAWIGEGVSFKPHEAAPSYPIYPISTTRSANNVKKIIDENDTQTPENVIQELSTPKAVKELSVSSIDNDVLPWRENTSSQNKNKNEIQASPLLTADQAQEQSPSLLTANKAPEQISSISATVSSSRSNFFYVKITTIVGAILVILL